MRNETMMQIEAMKKQTIGVEIEMSGITRRRAARIVAQHFGTIESYYGGGYDEWRVTDQQGRVWKLMYDSSIRASRSDCKCELVTPILTYDDIETLQEIVRLLRKAGAKSRPSLACGVHIHIGADIGAENGHNAKTLRNLTNIMASHEELLQKAINVPYHRIGYCRITDARFLREVNAEKPQTMQALEDIWYNRCDPRYRRAHYNDTRYHMLNLHATFTKGTVEFRCFNFEEPAGERQNGLHAGMLKGYIQLCLAMSQYAKTVKTASPRPVQQENAKYSMRIWMKRLCMVGEEFETARTVLMRNLDGNAAWRYGKQREDEIA